MPQRFLRPGITDSEKWNKISFKAQSLWIRILTLVDDFGRFDGRPSVICGYCFAVWNEHNPQDVVNPQETAALCTQLAAVGLVEFYDSGGKKVMQLSNWQERARASTSKWPAKSDNPQESAAESCGILRNPASLALDPRPRSSPSCTPEANGSGDTDTVKRLQEGLSRMYARPDNRAWTYMEQTALLEIARRPESLTELTLLESYKSRARFFPKSVSSLLQTWDQRLDEANGSQTPPPEETLAEKQLRKTLAKL